MALQAVSADVPAGSPKTTVVRSTTHEGGRVDGEALGDGGGGAVDGEVIAETDGAGVGDGGGDVDGAVLVLPVGASVALDETLGDALADCVALGDAVSVGDGVAIVLGETEALVAVFCVGRWAVLAAEIVDGRVLKARSVAFRRACFFR